MTRIVTSKRSQPDIGLMRDTVIVCTTVEVPDADVSTIVQLPGVIKVKASVIPLRGDTILNYKAVDISGKGVVPSTQITIRTPPDVKIDLNHKIYHLGRYGPTWYNVDTVEDLGGAGRFTVMLCSVTYVKDKRSDPVTQPQQPEWRVPTGMDEVI